MAVVVLVVVSILILKQPSKPPIEPETSSDANVELTDIPTTEPISTTDNSDEHPNNPDITIDVSGDGDGQSNKDGTQATTKTPAKKPEKPINPVTPTQPEGGGIHVGGDEEKPEKYSCGSPKHKCKNAEAHAYILNLELAGCQYCGSHRCPSFYGVDKWGNTGLFVELCPKYNKKQDPAHYCSDCVKKTGDGGNGTCARFIHDDTCPFCGQFVKANTCHSH